MFSFDNCPMQDEGFSVQGPSANNFENSAIRSSPYRGLPAENPVPQLIIFETAQQVSHASAIRAKNVKGNQRGTCIDLLMPAA
mmetsp:Transcript_13887/g.26500  ORF Transcript_13887/g.26500 Transcript_13887/m.26500 type:complete len:83 (+) Transcript_13887:25-273(+)